MNWPESVKVSLAGSDEGLSRIFIHKFKAGLFSVVLNFVWAVFSDFDAMQQVLNKLIWVIMIYDEGKGEKTLGFSQPLRKYIA